MAVVETLAREKGVARVPVVDAERQSLHRRCTLKLNLTHARSLSSHTLLRLRLGRIINLVTNSGVLAFLNENSQSTLSRHQQSEAAPAGLQLTDAV